MPTRSDQLTAKRGSDRLDAGSAPRRAEDRRNASRHWPKRSRRRPRAMISAIAAAATAPSVWLTRPWRTRASRRPMRAFAPVAMRSSSARRSSRCTRPSAVEQPGRRQFARSIARLRSSFAAVATFGSDGANLVGDIADQAMQHRRHQRPLLLRQALGADRGKNRHGQWTAGRGPRGARARSGRLPRAAIGHSSGIIAPAIIRFALTSRQLAIEWRTCWTMKKDSRGIDQKRDEIARPRAGRARTGSRQDRAAAGE